MLEKDITDEWAPSEKYPGYVHKRIRHNNCTSIVYRPILSEAEQEKREKTVKNALEYFGRKEMERKTKRTNTKEETEC